MNILELRILPSLAIARLGSSRHPLENFTLNAEEGRLGFRKIVPAETLYVNNKTGEIEKAATPDKIVFKDRNHRIRPVAPFLEVYARTSDETLQPLTLQLLKANGLSESEIKWTVEVGNIKAYRRTKEEGDKATANVSFSDHAVHVLNATAGNFLPGKVLPLGSVRYIKPTKQFPEIRLRFTPAAGLVYGASDSRIESDGKERRDRVVRGRVIYDHRKKRKGKNWWGYVGVRDDPTDTSPSSIYAGFDKRGRHKSWGYLDDECDGIVTVELNLGGGTKLSAFARIGAGPPHFAPDGLPVRTIYDELQQALLGPEVAPEATRLADAEDIVRRAAETVRFLNTAVMNGNPVAGGRPAENTMPQQDGLDTGRVFAPIMGTAIVDNRSVLGLHQAVLTALRSGTAPWFADALREPEKIGDLSEAERRKMPAMMRGADGRYLTLTRRQIDTIRKVATAAPFQQPSSGQQQAGAPTAGLTARNLTAQLGYLGRGNPPVSHPQSAISNCFPGLEFDFRNIWRRMFVGIELNEYDNYVAASQDPKYDDLVGLRLLAIEHKHVVVPISGPATPGGPSAPFAGEGASLEWSNVFALIQGKQGQRVTCTFTKRKAPNLVLPNKKLKTITRQLEVRPIFEQVTFRDQRESLPVLARDLAAPGELTQSLCSPWQNDYRECACYYWAASRPDFVNLVPTQEGTTRGAMWLQKDRKADYVLDDGPDPGLFDYDDLFKDWEKHLRFEIGGKDADVAADDHKAKKIDDT